VSNKINFIAIVSVDLQNSRDQKMLTHVNTTDNVRTKAYASKTWFQDGEGHFILYTGFP
jgi:hypothetical protein